MKWVVSILIFCAALHGTEQSLRYQEWIERLEDRLVLSGVLRADHAFVYLKIEDHFLKEIRGFLEEEGFIPPPYFGPGLVGAHITVIYPREMHEINIADIEEIGEIIPFTLKECQIVFPKTWENIEEVFLITVDAPALADLRTKYGFQEAKYDFHITLGVKPTSH